MIKPQDAALALPGSMAVRWDIARLYDGNESRALAAALGVCWTGPGRPPVRYTPGNPAAYGGAVIDELLARAGVSYADILEGGARAFSLIAGSLVSEAEVKEQEGNFAAAADQSSG